MEITGQELESKIKNGEKIIVDFWAKFCGPCRAMKPMFEKVAENMRDENSEVKLFTLDVEENRELSLSLGIRAVPTIKSFSKGKEVSSVMGMQSEFQINEMVKSLLNE